MVEMVTSGYLDQLGFDYKPAQLSTIFRAPHTVRLAHAPAG